MVIHRELVTMPGCNLAFEYRMTILYSLALNQLDFNLVLSF